MIQLQLPSERATADRSRLIQLFLWCGAISGPLAVLVITIDGFLRPGYSPISQVVSDLGIGENAWILNTTLMVSGQVSMLFALGFSQSRTAPGAGRLVLAHQQPRPGAAHPLHGRLACVYGAGNRPHGEASVGRRLCLA